MVNESIMTSAWAAVAAAATCDGGTGQHRHHHHVKRQPKGVAQTQERDKEKKPS